MKIPAMALAASLLIALPMQALSQIPRTPSVAGAKLSIVEPRDGASVRSPVKVVMGLSGQMGVAPAGVPMAETGHHHILVNVDALPTMGMPLPADDKHRHFGKGQTEAMLTLPPGRHTLQLLLGDHNHVPHNPPLLSEKITITVLP
jgi:hypothetical protein